MGYAIREMWPQKIAKSAEIKGLLFEFFVFLAVKIRMEKGFPLLFGEARPLTSRFFGVRRQSAVATALSERVADLNVQPLSQSGVALRLPPQSKTWRQFGQSGYFFWRSC
jgi:hypothetical protein